MADQTIYWKGPKAELMTLLAKLPKIMAGTSPEHAAISRSLSARMGNALLANIKLDFERKESGGVGEDGQQWAPNTFKTVMRKVRKHQGALKGKSPAAQARRERLKKYRELMQAAMKKLRPQYVTADRVLSPKMYSFQMSILRKAAARSVGYFPHEIRDELGFEDVVFPFALTLILRDTSMLFNSLTAGLQEAPYRGEGSEYQVFRPVPGSVIVGTNLIYAATHQHGDQTRHLPARPFLPVGKLPHEWMEDILDVLRSGIVRIIQTKGAAL